MMDDDDDDYYVDDDDEGGRLDLGSFLGDEDPDDEEDEGELDDEALEEKAAIKRMIEAVNREEARESFESMMDPEEGYPEADLDAFITEWAYEFYDQGATAIDWNLVD